MRCPKCNAENVDQARFCMNCAAPLVVVCPQCGTELPPQARFCFRCAAPVTAPPAESAKEISFAALPRAIQRMVPKEYAERLLAASSRAVGQRRTVTILFSDVKGSTAMAEKLDPEDVAEVMNGVFDFLIPPIYHYEGTLVQLMGDAILAFFGAPIAHEDDPERACRAGLEITAEAAEYANKLKRERGIEGFNVRVGINTGLVVVGELGTDLRMAYTAMGDAINLAARMEQNAAPGTVLITEATHRLVAPLFDTEAVGPLQVKGKAEPVAAYRVRAAKPAAGKVRGIAGLESPLVGREAELAALREVIERLQAGVGGIVTLGGEAGIGKSRLVAETKKAYPQITQIGKSEEHRSAGCQPAAQESADYPCWRRVLRDQSTLRTEVQWVEGRCLSYGTSIAYLLWLDVLRNWLGVTVEDSPEKVREKLRERVSALCGESFDVVFPYVARLLSLPLDKEAESRLSDLDGQQLKAGTFDAVEALLSRTAAQHPLVLALEDLHWADPTSAELLERLLSLTERTPILFLCVLRPEPECPSWHVRETAARSYPHCYTDLWLNPLSIAASRTLVANLLRVEELPPALKERILAVTEGNPFYVEEVLRSLIDQQAIARDETSGQWRATRDVADIAIPDTLQGVLLARIDRLQEDTKRVLQLASVIGRIFLYRVLHAIAEEERQLDRHLLALQQQELIRERARIPELEYIFKHELTREAAYNGLLRKQRRAFHRQVAEALERLFPERIEEQLGLLAYHWERAEEPDKASAYLLRAGDQARLAYAHPEAVGYYQRALAILKAEKRLEQAARTCMKLGITHHAAFDFRASRQAYDEGFRFWQQAQRQQVPTVPPAPHALRGSDAYLPPTLDIAMARDTLSRDVITMYFSGLVEYTHELEIVPDVAESWEVLGGGCKYLFHLRRDVVWTDGVSVTAYDFEYSVKRWLAPANRSGYAIFLYDIRGARAFHQGLVADPETVGVKAMDAWTLVIELEEPVAQFLHVVARLFPVPRHVVEARGAAWTDPRTIVTNGPWRIEAWEPKGVSVDARNPYYHGRFTGNVQRMVDHIGLSPERQLQMYEADELDIFGFLALPLPLANRVRERHVDEVVSNRWLGNSFVAFNDKLPPFHDLRVRRAFVLATDKEALADTVLPGYLCPAMGGFVPPGMPGHTPGTSLPYDPKQAQRLLAEAGYPGGRGFPAVEALFRPFEDREARALRTQWQENLGVDLVWQPTEVADLLDRLSEDPPQVYITGWSADYPDPRNFLEEAIQVRTAWRNKGYDRLLQEARRLRDQTGRMKLYQQAERILIEEAAVLPLFYDWFHCLVKPWVKNWPMSIVPRAYHKDLIIEPH